jgi:MYND finger
MKRSTRKNGRRRTHKGGSPAKFRELIYKGFKRKIKSICIIIEQDTDTDMKNQEIILETLVNQFGKNKIQFVSHLPRKPVDRHARVVNYINDAKHKVTDKPIFYSSQNWGEHLKGLIQFLLRSNGIKCLVITVPLEGFKRLSAALGQILLEIQIQGGLDVMHLNSMSDEQIETHSAKIAANGEFLANVANESFLRMNDPRVTAEMERMRMASEASAASEAAASEASVASEASASSTNQSALVSMLPPNAQFDYLRSSTTFPNASINTLRTASERGCNYCGRPPNMGTRKHRRCAGPACRNRNTGKRYCSEECQYANWPSHRAEERIAEKFPGADPNAVCWHCGATMGRNGRSLRKCAGCEKARYCCADCQRADWPQHKKECERRKTE